MSLIAPELWPAHARQWFELHDRFFWQERMTAVGYREFPKDIPHSDWTMDVDAGPVIAGHGVAASAFGVGAARKNGRFDRAYPLATEMLATVFELPNGTLALPRVLSDMSDAPMLGETAILWQLTVQPEKGIAVRSGGGIPTFTYILLISVFVFGAWRIWEAIGSLRQSLWPSARSEERVIFAPKIQSGIWMGLMVMVIGSLASGYHAFGLAALVLGVLLPATKKKKPPTGAEDWPDPPQGKP